MIEIRRVRGPLDDEQLGWLAQLYGPVDAKYGSPEYLRHQFVENPFGWSVHVFAVAEKGAVGHCGVVPFRARLGREELTVGKLEALAVAPAYRGRRAEDGGSVATDILVALYAFALESELPVLFGLAPPPVAAIHVRAGCRRVPLDAPAYVLVTCPRTFAQGTASPRRRVAVALLSRGQRTMLAALHALARVATATWAGPEVETPGADDVGLAAAELSDGRLTVSGADAWDWYLGSGVLKVIRVPGRFGSRAIVRVDESHETTVQIVAWQPRRPGLLPALLMLGAAARLARSRSAPTLRFQPWRGSGGDGALAAACRLAGLVKRPEADLLLHSRDPAFAALEAQLTPFFYVTF